MQNHTSYTFGTEIEFILPENLLSTLEETLRDNGINARYHGYTHQVMSDWKIVYDASVGGRTGYRGFEIVSPVLTGEDGFQQIEKVCKSLNQVGAKVNRTCGLHVHIGARNIQPEHAKALLWKYMLTESVIDMVMPNSRRNSNNQYCLSMKPAGFNFDNEATRQNIRTARSLSQVFDMGQGGTRYRKLNFASFNKYGTVEFRHHSGTIEAAKINNWIKVCRLMVRKAMDGGAIRKHKEVAADLKGLRIFIKDILGVGQNEQGKRVHLPELADEVAALTTYYVDRAKKLNPSLSSARRAA